MEKYINISTDEEMEGGEEGREGRGGGAENTKKAEDLARRSRLKRDPGESNPATYSIRRDAIHESSENRITR